MPYIKAEDKKSAQWSPFDAGQLNFAFTQLIIGYIDLCGLDYQTINEVLGALEGCKLEFYRRVAVPYEQDKMARNGDVYSGVKGANP